MQRARMCLKAKACDGPVSEWAHTGDSNEGGHTVVLCLFAVILLKPSPCVVMNHCHLSLSYMLLNSWLLPLQHINGPEGHDDESEVTSTIADSCMCQEINRRGKHATYIF